MFGYIVINKPELKIKDYETYRSYYCGLCKTLKERYGFSGRMSLNYDTTFLAILLDALYEPDNKVTSERCVTHPFVKHKICRSIYTDYAADMNVLLTYYKCKDDWQDEKKHIKNAYAKLLTGKMKSKESCFLNKKEKVEELLSELSKHEKEKEADIDAMAGIFGKLLGHIFAYTSDEWEDELYRMGFFLGKFIYLCDAYEDLEEDMKKGNYNPFANMHDKAGFDDKVKNLLTMMMAQCCKEFETLPIIKNLDILRNILYSGVWSRYEIAVDKKRKQEGVADT
ncbi:MAG: hypothetical protein IJW18_06930 [Lachnospiraceae bacterium]|nr:hypothetical protein [Lachnospiraceae bacterium]